MAEFKTWGVALVDFIVEDQSGADKAAKNLDKKLREITMLGYEIFSIVPLSSPSGMKQFGGITRFVLVTARKP
jgi:hypothetical protein